MPQCCYLAKGAKWPSHTTNMQPFQLSLFTFGTRLSAFGKFVKVICLGLNCRGTQLSRDSIDAFCIWDSICIGTQFVLGLNRCLTRFHAWPPMSRMIWKGPKTSSSASENERKSNKGSKTFVEEVADHVIYYPRVNLLRKVSPNTKAHFVE